MRLALLTIECLVIGPLVGLVYGQRAPDTQSLELSTVLGRAEAYVSAYEEQLGALIGEEAYQQDAVWRGQTLPSQVISRERRRLTSDFLLLQYGTRWYAVRNVLRVDGTPVDEPETLPESIEAIIATRADTQYNIGAFYRTINIPTFGLAVFRKENFRRFSFDKSRESKVENFDTWEVAFSETAGPTLVQGFDGEDRYAHGRFWIRPETGEILRTEIVFEAESDGTLFRVTISTAYKPSPELGMLVPSRMEEHYESRFHSVDARADYVNFKRFTVQVDTDTDSAQE